MNEAADSEIQQEVEGLLRADRVLDELSNMRVTFRRTKSREELEYEQGDIGGG